jgi:hypothetical protein
LALNTLPLRELEEDVLQSIELRCYRCGLAVGCSSSLAVGEQFDADGTDDGLDALLLGVLVSPAVKAQLTDDAYLVALGDVVGQHLCLLAPSFNGKPVGFLILGRAAHGEVDFSNHTTGLEVAQLGIGACPTD